jgi:TonB-dependent receptor
VVDSITATDVGAFPDKSVAEALQRVAGITVNRFAATSDTAHFSAEPSGVIVRGLQQVRSEFNGRDIFSANSGRGLSWGDISPELMARVDVYKNQTADLIEGGIAGTIDLRTRVPFDAPGQLFAATIQTNYGDISRKWTPEASLVYSNRWNTSFGDVGFLANLAYSTVQTESEGLQLSRMVPLNGVFGQGMKYVPSQARGSDNLYDRTRTGFAFAAQWQDNEGKFLLTAQYNRSDYTNEWHERTATGNIYGDIWGKPTDFEINSSTSPNPIQPLPGTPAFTFDDQGVVRRGTFVSPVGWWGNNNDESALVARNAAGQPLVNACYGWNGCTPDVRAADFVTQSRYSISEQFTDDASINLKWNPTDRLRMNFDIQRVHSTIYNYDMSVELQSFAAIDLDMTGDIPTVNFIPGPNINYSPGFLTNPNNYAYRSLMDHTEDSEGTQMSYRADLQYDFDTDWLDSLKVGVRHAKREQDVRWSAYNWQNVANVWTNNADYYNIDKHTPGPNGFKGYPRIYEVNGLGRNFFGGDRLGPQQHMYINMTALENRRALAATMGRAATGVGAWDPICDRSNELPDSCYRATELNDVEETTNAIYAMLKFGGENAMIGNIGISGNIGVRYVHTKDVSTGSLAFPRQFTPQELECKLTEIPPNLPPGTPIVPRSPGCYLSPQEIAFNSGGGIESTAEATHKNWLPSFNLKLQLNPEWQVRFAASRAMARPDIGYLKNYLGISAQASPSTSNPGDPRWIKDAAGNVIGLAPTYTAEAYNPYLKPQTADQFDLSIENYFADVGSFSLAFFYKQFYDYVQYGGYNRTVTNNGVTREVRVRGPVNGEGAKLSGFEVAYQRFLDFLPDPFDGLGFQANFTYVKNQGITNTSLTSVSGDGGAGVGGGGLVAANDSITVDVLEGVSKYAYNLVGMYEKGPWALRLAYNWRSEYLVTAVDCCVGLPVWQDAAGFLDGSIRYKVSDNIELNVQASNILNTRTVLKQQVNDHDKGGLLLPNAWFQNDRRLQAGIRFKY